MLIPVLLFSLGLVLLIKGGDWFVDGSTGLARRFHIPEIIVGATVVSIGTTLPEVMVSATSALQGIGDMAYGNAIGSIICNTSLIAALTIGTPSFFLAMEPNYERVTGHFIRGVLRRAFPGGLTNILVVVLAQVFSQVFSLTAQQTATVCAGILGAVGLLVLLQTCRPFGKFRTFLWCAMAVALVICFSVFAPFFELDGYSRESGVILAALLLVTPTVFFAVQWLFDRGDKALLWIRSKAKKADM